jgi:uncharacterized protein (DUF2342 family)
MEEAVGDQSLLSPNSRVAKRRIQEAAAGALRSTQPATKRLKLPDPTSNNCPEEIKEMMKPKPQPKVIDTGYCIDTVTGRITRPDNTIID